MKKFNDLRVSYDTFIYDSYTIREDKDEVHVVYHFEIPGLGKFEPSWRFPKGEHKIKELTQNGTFLEMVFSLGMVELISYWKMACSPNVVVNAGELNDDQIRWWKELYYLGLGEFFYTNGIDTTMEDFMKIDCKAIIEQKYDTFTLKDNSGCLVPIGGGKDSVVSLELLKSAGENIKCFIINPRGATLKTVQVGGFMDSLLVAKRTLDRNMIELNRRGFLNGHTPYSAIVAFSATITAYLAGLKYISLSNEASANESTVKGSDVNHQYSKSFKFEEDFHKYEETYIKSGTYYFSLLRPLSEFQIAAYFSKCTQYHSIFRSCNVGSKEDKWCGHCPKCLFVFLILSPFLPHRRLCEIFGADMLNDETMIETLDKLIGRVEEKPFECVGSREEVNTAICLAIKNLTKSAKDKEDVKLPKLFSYYTTTEEYKNYYNSSCHFFEEFDDNNLLPEKFEKLVRKMAEELK